jgi:DNA-binding PadR family transcriptional regulator
MATKKKIDVVILGILSHEPATGYEIKRQLDLTVSYFWNASYGSIYPALSELEQAGLVTREDVSTNRREKLLYTITETGRARLREWLTVPVEKDELRYETLLKLYFGCETEPEVVLRHIEQFERKFTENLKMMHLFEANLERVKDDEPAHRYYLMTVRFGIYTYEAYLKWCAETKRELRAAPHGGAK